jgi:serine/threonine protein kinase
LSPDDLGKLSRDKKLGEGTYGKVWLLSDPRYACKVHKNDGDEGLDPCTMREIAALRKLETSPHIVRCAAVGSKHEIYMPTYETSLKDYLLKCSRSPERARTFMHQLLCGVNAMHQAGIVHRDLKPDNILVGDEIVISDMGATRFGIDDMLPITGHNVVTLWYRAPEVLLGDRKYTAAVDMWSLGVIMCGLLPRVADPARDLVDVKLMITGGGKVEVETDEYIYSGGKGRFEMLEGDCAIDQAYRIFRLRGTPTNTTWSGVEQLPDFKSSFPKWESRDLSKIFDAPPEALDLLGRLLTLDPTRRITVREALAHDYFRGLEIPLTGVQHHEQCIIDPNYMTRQNDINSRMRHILVDWMILVAVKLKLDHMTFFLAVTYLDLFLMKRLVSRAKLQLVGCTAMLMATKIVEVYPTEITEFISISDRAYNREQIIAMEGNMLSALDYRLYRTTEYTYMTWHTGTLERKELLKKLYHAVTNLENRRYTWAELMRADIAVDTKYRGAFKMAEKIDRTM